MKNFNLTQMLQGCSRSNEMTVSATNSGGGQTCQVKQQTRLMSVEEKWSENGALSSTCLRSASVPLSFRSRYLRYAAMVVLLLCVGVGEMWATEYYLLDHSGSSATFTGQFICNPTDPTADSRSFSDKSFKGYVKTTGNMTSWSNKAAETYTIDYDVKTTSTTFTIYVGNTSTNTPQMKYAVYDESTSAHSSPDVALTNIGEVIPKGSSTAQYTTRTVTITRSKNARVCFCTDKYTAAQIYQIVANETGTPLPQVGEGGYTLNFNKGRLALTGSTYIGQVDNNIEIRANSGYNMGNTANIVIANGKTSSQYIKFTTPASPGKLKLTYTGGQMAYNKSASASGATSITSGTQYTLDASTTYYLVNTGAANSTITNLEFTAPKMVYLKNSMGWSNAYLTLLGTSSYWNSDRGTGSYGKTTYTMSYDSSKKLFYVEVPAASNDTYINFTNTKMENYGDFNSGQGIYVDGGYSFGKVVYLTTTNTFTKNGGTMTYLGTDSYGGGTHVGVGLETYSPDVYLCGSHNSWTKNDAAKFTAGTPYTKTVSLTAGTAYTFKIVDNAWFGLDDTWLMDDKSGLTFSQVGGNVNLLAPITGDYTFTYNRSTHAVTVTYPDHTHPNSGYVYVIKYDWGGAYLHAWGSSDLTSWGSDLQLSYYEDICGTEYWCIPVLSYYSNFIVKDQAGDPSNTTGDQSFTSNGGKNMYHDGSSWGWHSFTSHTISYAKGTYGSGTMSSTTGICNSADQELPACSFSPSTGYEFSHWTADVAVTVNSKTVSIGSPIADEATLQNITGNIALTANWSLVDYNVTYSAPTNGSYTIKVGDGSATSATQTANMDNTVAIAATPSDGYYFTGWTVTNTSTSADVTSTLLAGAKATTASTNFTMPAYGVTIVATFAAKKSVTYKKNGGASGADGSVTGSTTDASSPYAGGAEVTTVANGFTNSGYKFKWWNTTYGGDGEDFYPGEKFNISANTLLYAQWEQVASGWEYWVGDNFTFTDNVMSVGDLRITRSSSGVSSITDVSEVVSKYNSTTDKKANTLKITSNSKYVQLHFSDGSPINALELGVATDQTSNKNIVVCYSTTADFSSGEYEFKKVGSTDNLVSVPGKNQSSKAVTDVSPSTTNKYTYVRIYRKLANSTDYNSTGGDLGSGNNTNIYSIKAQKGCLAPTTTFSAGAYTVGDDALDLRTLLGSKQGSGAITFEVTNDDDETGATIGVDGYSLSATSAGSCTVTATQAASVPYCEKVIEATITISPACTTPTVSWSTTPANGIVGGSMTAAVTTNYSDGLAYSVTGATPSGCVTINSSGVISYVKPGKATVKATVTGDGTTYCEGPAEVSQAIIVHNAQVDDGTYVYYYSDETHFDGTNTYKNPEGNTPESGDGVAFSNSAYTLPNSTSIDGLTSVVVNSGCYDNKGNHINSYIKLTGGTSTIVFTIETGYTATIKIKAGGYSGAQPYYMKLNNEGDAIAPTTGSMGGAATIEDNFTELVWSDLEAGSYTFKASTSGKNLYVSQIDIETTLLGYAITNGSPSGGTIAITDGLSAITAAEEGATVYIAATPNTGYSFSSWDVYQTSSSSTKVVLTDEDDHGSFKMPAYAVTVDATFTAIDYTLTWDMNGGKVTTAGTGAAVNDEGEQSATLNYGDAITTPVVARSGYKFAGWDNGSGIVTPASTMPAGNVTYTAQWHQQFTVTHNLSKTATSSGTTAYEDEDYSATYVADEGYALPTTVLVYRSLTNITASCTWDQGEGTLTIPGAQITGDITVTVRSVRAECSVTYNGNSPTSGSAPTDSKNYRYGDVVTVKGDNGMIKTGYNFRGWLDDDSDIFYQEGQTFIITDNVTLTAVWEPTSSGGGGTSVYKFHTKTGMTPSATININKSVTSVTTSDGDVTATSGNYLSELSGGTLGMNLGSNGDIRIATDSCLYYNNSNAYMQPTLSTATIQRGDIIKYRISGANIDVRTSTSDYSANTDVTLATGRNNALVSNSMHGLSSVYLYRNSSSAAYITYFEIYRPSEVLFYAEAATGMTAGNVSATETQRTTSDYLTYITGGNLYTGGNSDGDVKITANELQLKNNNGYIKITLSKALAKGDIIIFNSSTNYQTGITLTKSRSTTISTANKMYPIPADNSLIGESTIYLWKGSGDTNIRTIAIVRPGAGSDSNFDVTFDDGTAVKPASHDEWPSSMVGVPSGKKISVDDPITVGYAFLGWYDDEGCSVGHEVDLEDFTVTEDITLYAKWVTNEHTFTGAAGTTAWETDGNWASGTAPNTTYPYSYAQVYIKKPAVMATDTKERVGRVDIVNDGSMNTGKLTINSGAMLIVYDRVYRVENWSTKERLATDTVDVYLGSEFGDNYSIHHKGGINGALIMGKYNGTGVNATVQFASLAWFNSSLYNETDKWAATDINQYIGIPFNELTPNDYDNHDPNYDRTSSMLYSYETWMNNWYPLIGTDKMHPFEGYDILWIRSAQPKFDLKGTLVASENQTINLRSYGGPIADYNENLLANSWAAPINIAKFEEEDFVNAEATIYIFNAGTGVDYGDIGWTYGKTTLPGQYSSLPIEYVKAYYDEYDGFTTIPSMQSFSILSTDGATHSITLDYKRLVYQGAIDYKKIEPMHAPGRAPKAWSKPMEIKIAVEGTKGLSDMVRILEREDFTEGFDNGWEASKLCGIWEAPSLYAATETGSRAVVAVPDVEGQELVFRAGSVDNVYTISFEYKGTEQIYLYDKETQVYTLIETGATYTFATNGQNDDNRFVLTRNYVPAVTTGIDTQTGESRKDVQKVLINDHIYILRNGRMYDATGKSVK